MLDYARARVIGGCSSHNGCAAIVGSRLDYDGWEALGCTGWGMSQMRGVFEGVLDRMRVHLYAPEQVTPFQQAFLDAAPAAGLPLVTDLNDWDEDAGIAPSPVNVVDGVRWNAAFAYLDPVRDRASVQVVGDATVVRVVLRGDRAVGVELMHDGRMQRVGCDRVVVTAGAYGSPGILERSGIGDPDVLRAARVEVLHELPGVGANLHDHPAVKLVYPGGPDADTAMAAFGASNYLPEEQVIAKAASSLCREGFDLHLYPVSLILPGGGWAWELSVACLTPLSRGSIHIRDADAATVPAIDHRYCSDPDGARPGRCSPTACGWRGSWPRPSRRAPSWARSWMRCRRRSCSTPVWSTTTTRSEAAAWDPPTIHSRSSIPACACADWSSCTWPIVP